ncbi:MAG: dihydrofolate reductase [Flavobacteriales bacterium]|nr:dihydrofolate reductase [Flavobacteriales bacterium]MCB9448436.1 dihydrofolate reductase [Flavobacteriales bacterium]
MTLSIIVAVSENHAIGVQNDLPWHLPADLAYFKKLTSGHTILMGRKTYESIGRPLPNRKNIVITRQPDLQIPGCTVVGSLEDALQACENDDEVFLIGGAEMYAAGFPKTDRLYITHVHVHVNGDRFFPVLDPNEWQLMSSEAHPQDERHAYPFTFSVYERVSHKS